MPAPTFISAVRIDDATAGSASGSQAIVVPANATLAVVCIACADWTISISTVTLGGDACTIAVQDASQTRLGIAFKAAPLTGSRTLAWTYSGNTTSDIVVLFYADSIASPAGATAFASNSGTAISAAVTTTGEASIVVGVAGSRAGGAYTFTPGAGVTEREDEGATGIEYQVGELAAGGPGAKTYAATLSAAVAWGLVVAEFKGTANSAGARPMIAGVGRMMAR